MMQRVALSGDKKVYSKDDQRYARLWATGLEMGLSLGEARKWAVNIVSTTQETLSSNPIAIEIGLVGLGFDSEEVRREYIDGKLGIE